VRTIIGIVIAAFLTVCTVPAFAEPPASQPAEKTTKVTKGKKHKRHAKARRHGKKHHQA